MLNRKKTPAERRLDLALVALVERRLRPRCGDPVDHHFWTSERQEEREQAAAWCAGCPILVQCHEAAASVPERFGVWGGRDRSPQGRQVAP